MNVDLISIWLCTISSIPDDKKATKIDMFWVQFYMIFWIWAFLSESIEKIVTIDTKCKYWKSIAKIYFSFRQYVWLYCATFSLGCRGGEYGIVTPCTYISGVYHWLPSASKWQLGICMLTDYVSNYVNMFFFQNITKNYQIWPD